MVSLFIIANRGLVDCIVCHTISEGRDCERAIPTDPELYGRVLVVSDVRLQISHTVCERGSERRREKRERVRSNAWPTRSDTAVPLRSECYFT